MNMDKIGSANAHFLSLMTAPANSAMAYCGANPNGRKGITLYNAANTIIKKRRGIKCLFDLIEV
jgi:hypothetical protein